MKKSFLCIIPARGGSKRLPNKNIINLNGNPLISYSIRAAQESNMFDEIIVSTDSKEIKEISERYGSHVPFLRPKYLSGDEVLVEEAICHLLKQIEKQGKKFDYICLVQCSTPLILPEDFKNMISILQKKKAKMVVSVAETPVNVNWVGKLSKNLSMENFFNYYGSLCQHFEQTYILNGAIYMGEWDIFYNKKNYYSKKTFAYIMPQERSFDIDDINDLKLVEFFMKDK
jgi:CMP-N,N'-diacetyllegionaminic acid synthase